MKIAQVVCSYPPYRGGIGNVAKAYSKYLKNRGHDVTVFSPCQKNVALEPENKPLKPLLAIGHGGIYPAILSSLGTYDLVLFHYPFFGAAELFLLWKILKGRKSKLILFYHMDTENLGFFKKFLSLPSFFVLPLLLKYADKVLCSSVDYVATGQIGALYEKYRQKFVELPFSINTKNFSPGDHVEREELHIGFVGALDKAHYFKGLDLLLKAVSVIDNKIKLKIIGKGDLRESYMDLAQTLGLADRTEFLDQVDNEQLIFEYRSMDIFVLPSINRHEAFGIVLLEAMSCGVPVIAPALPGVRKVFQEGEQGLYFEPGNEKDLTEKLRNLIADPDTRKKMSSNARIFAVENYSEQVIEKELENIIRSLS